MLKTVEGVYRDGKVELSEAPPEIDAARVLVTFLPQAGPIDLRKLGINQAEAAKMRAQFECIAEDWDSLQMDLYNEL